MHSAPHYRYTSLLLLSRYISCPLVGSPFLKLQYHICQSLNRLLSILRYTIGATAPRGALRQQPGVVSTRSGCNALSLGSKLIISSLHTDPSCRPPRSRICLISITTYMVGFLIGLSRNIFIRQGWRTWAEFYILYRYGDHQYNQSINSNQRVQNVS